MRPNLRIFWTWTHKTLALSAAMCPFSKITKRAKSLHPNRQCVPNPGLISAWSLLELKKKYFKSMKLFTVIRKILVTVPNVRHYFYFIDSLCSKISPPYQIIKKTSIFEQCYTYSGAPSHRPPGQPPPPLATTPRPKWLWPCLGEMPGLWLGWLQKISTVFYLKFLTKSFK